MALTQGDIAFISFNANENGWSIVTFVNIDPNTTIYFSDGTVSSPTTIGSTESSFVWNTECWNASSNQIFDSGCYSFRLYLTQI
ncbi:hypothetical protein [Nostoc sp. DSM 114167]|jgi:hypothetical protein|uniref:hypothetical protein n=1 Tax=Nostoc sp. DSM 114167 TaxID=3439050 RepID=UPI00404687E2